MQSLQSLIALFVARYCLNECRHRYKINNRSHCFII